MGNGKTSRFSHWHVPTENIDHLVVADKKNWENNRMMVETTLARSVRIVCAGGLLGLGLIAPLGQALAQTADQPMQRVEVTGSSIKRLVSETANPLSVFKADDFVKQGLTTAQEVLCLLYTSPSPRDRG